MKIAAMGDIHCTVKARGMLEPMFEKVAQQCDLLLLCGDLTDYGTADEALTLGMELRATAERIPVVAVLGNHDYDAGQERQVHEILTASGVHLLDGDRFTVGDVGVAGVKGFGGGFGRRQLGAFGEEAIKHFVQEAVEEARKLESALTQLQTPYRIAMTHYAPIMATTAPEPPELFPFLGSSHLEDVIDQNGVTMALHGHAHYGAPEGRTSTGIPVYNVALPVLRRAMPQQVAVRMLELGANLKVNTP
ncbi:MAG TPA: metallophosphoesterase [Candidatus Xenobia bacterium]